MHVVVSAHELSVGQSDEWYTPPYVFEALGETFDLDVAHPGLNVMSWAPAVDLISVDSLDRDWHGFLWMNAPFGKRNGLEPWLERFIAHGNGIALTPDRTSAPWWQTYAKRADLALFVAPKIKFIRPDGSRGEQPGTGTTLLARGARGARALWRAEMLGLGVTMTP